MQGKNKFGMTEFKKPNLPELRENGMFSADMHFHSNLDEGYLAAQAIMKTLKNRKMAAAITDHNLINGAVKLSANSELIIPGAEFISKEGVHCLFYFYNAKELQDFYSNHIEKNIDASYQLYLKTEILDILDISRQYNCVSCLPHPFSYFNSEFHEMLKGLLRKKKINAVETINGWVPHHFNRAAANFSLNIKTGVTGGTDGRTLQELGNVVTCAKACTKEEFLDALLKRKTIVIGRETNAIGRLRNLLYRPEMRPKNWTAPLMRRMRIVTSGKAR